MIYCQKTASSCSRHATVCYLCKARSKAYTDFYGMKRKIIYMHRLCDGLAVPVEILSSSQLLPPLMEIFSLQIGLPGRVTNQLKSRSRAYFTFRACYIAGVSFMYLTYTTENTPVKRKTTSCKVPRRMQVSKETSTS